MLHSKKNEGAKKKQLRKTSIRLLSVVLLEKEEGTGAEAESGGCTYWAKRCLD
jgi:hypothetical protein